jgi:serine/threonine-protein kinase
MQIDPTQWADFSRLIDAMLDQPEAQREAWARALTGEDAAFAPRLIELLKPTGRTGNTAWFETLPKFTGLESDAGPDASQLLEQKGDHIGPYRLVRLLGTGGMGSVWYAERSDQLKRRAVALKLPLALSNRTLAARFEREREILAGLVHPNIARLYDAGISSAGRAYLALEYVEGESLDKFCDGRRLDLDARIDLFQQVLAAVQYAHSRLVIHRDIKPSNILVTAEGQVRLLDFGVAKLLDSEKGEETELTQLGGAGMTLAYAAPEQIAGQAVSTATDIYALGVVLYELLTGSRPYRPARDTRGALEESILKGDIPLASAIAMDAKVATARSGTEAQVQRALRGDLDAILLKALQREPAQRYATVATFAEDLARFRAGQVVQAHKPSPGYQLRKFIVRNRLVVGSATAAGLALLIGAGIAVWQAHEAKRQELIAERERDQALSAAAHREAVDDFLSDLLTEAGRSGEPISVPSLIARADAISAGEFSENPDARAAVLRTVGRFEAEFQDLEGALKYFDQAHGLLKESPDAALWASVGCSRAMVLGFLDRSAESDTAFRQVLDDPRMTAGGRSECLRQKAELALYRSDGGTAGPLIDAALQELNATAHRSPRKYLDLLTFRAMALAQSGRPAKAEEEYVRILGELRKIGRERGEAADFAQLGRIEAAYDSGDFRLALDLIGESIAAQDKDIPGRTPLIQLYQRGTILAYMERYQEALAEFDEIARLAANKEVTLARRANLDAAEMLSRLGRLDAAEHRFVTTIRSEAGDPASTPHDLAALLCRAKINLARRDFAGARSILDRVEHFEAVPPHSLAMVHYYRSIANLALGDAQGAERDAEIAVAAGEKRRGDRKYSIWVGFAQLALGQALEAKGDFAAARDVYRSAAAQIAGSAGREHPGVARANDALRRVS